MTAAQAESREEWMATAVQRPGTPARIAHRIPTPTADKAALTTLFSTFDLDVTRHNVVRKPSNKYRHSNLLYRLATKSVELSGLGRDG